MPIQRNAAPVGSSKYISDPGEYVVSVNEVQFAKSKKGDPMVTIKFVTDDKRMITGYFVKKYPFMMEQLNNLKLACGESADTTADELIGKKCGILVEKGKVDNEGKSFPSIVGYGSTTEVDNSKVPQGYQAVADPSDEDVMPF